MTVAELIAALLAAPPDDIVCDDEGRSVVRVEVRGACTLIMDRCEDD